MLSYTTFANNVNTGGAPGVVRTMSARPLGMTGINAGASIQYARDGEYVTGPNGVGSVINSQTGLIQENGKPVHMLSGDVYFAYGLFKYLDFSVDIPLYADITGWKGDATGAGVGDLGLALKLAHPQLNKDAILTSAYYLGFTFPTGKQDNGYFPRHSYYLTTDSKDAGRNLYTANSVLFNPMFILSLDFNKVGKGFPLMMHGNIGAAVTQKKNSSALLGSFAIDYTPVDMLTLFVELSGEARVKYYTESFEFESFVKDPFIFSPGARVNLPFGMYITVAGDIGISSHDREYKANWNRDNYSYATSPIPRYAVQLSVGWTGIVKKPDTDNDGIIDEEDKCPYDAEDMDKFEDDDGCPDLDNDGDGIADKNDQCPDAKATCDGCPVYDTDNDGINDDVDKCPKQAEDMDGFEDADGCPELDNDGDGVPDATDKCPLKPEDMDGFEDTDGCPELDNDGDGIPDDKDKCPNRKGVPEAQGCPKTKEIQRGKLILGGVNFQSGKAILTQNSYRVLDQIYESLAEWTEVKLEIQGYTDSQGKYENNKRLSHKRAQAVMNYLVQKAINPSRLRAVGYGEDSPIADNKTASGRAKNRRVELNRID